MARAGEGVLLLTGESTVYRYLPATDGAPFEIKPLGTYPFVAPLEGEAFGSSAEKADVTRFSNLTQPNVSTAQYTKMADAGVSGGLVAGGSPLGTDCSSLFIYRADQRVWRTTIEAGAFERWVDSGRDGARELLADERNIYIVTDDLGGITAFAKSNGARRVIADGNFWGMAVDADGIYWGDHARDTGGTIFMAPRSP